MLKRISISQKFEPLFNSSKRYNLLYGGRGSGKSYVAAQFFVLKALQPAFFRGVMCREVAGTIRASQFQELKDLINDWGVSDKFIIRENTMEFECLETGNKIISMGLKKSSSNQTAKVKSIKDPSHIWVEEADEISYEDFIKLDTSIRTTKVEQVQIILTFNPENEESWINTKWFINNEPNQNDNDSLIIHSTFRDNIKNLQQSYINTLERLRSENPEYAKIYIDGLWGGGAKGRIFQNIINIDTLPDGQVFYGLDFGFSNDPTALVKCVLHNQKLYVQELIYQTDTTNRELIQLLKHHNVGKGIIWCDSAEPKSIQELRTAGFNAIPAIKGKDSILAGIQYLKSLQIHITNDSTNLLKESKYYSWHVIDGKPTNQPIDAYNHAIDAVRYAVASKHLKPTRSIRTIN